MKLIYVATLSDQPDRDSQWIKSFSDLGIQVIPFSTLKPQLLNPDFLRRVRDRLNFGKEIRYIRDSLVKLIKYENPDWVHFRLPVEFDYKTLVSIKNTGVIISEYYNDDPFSQRRVLGWHRLFRKNIGLYDLHFVYRKKNISEFKSAGAKLVFHCPPTYIPYRHLKLPDYSFNSSSYDAVFIGHWENDGRANYINALVQNGFKVGLFGSNWNQALKNSLSKKLGHIRGLYGAEYNRLYAEAKAGICFFSKLNNDTWTERALEIIAVGGILVCERTCEAEKYFEDRKEALFFSNVSELIYIVTLLTSDLQLNNTIRKAGYEKLLRGKHSITDRAQMILAHVNKIRK